MAETTEAQLRWERKFVTFELDVREIEAVIRFHPALFHEIYAARYVNNLYLDTPSLDHYQANAAGVARRVKCRIRWYGDLRGPVARPTLELKRKQGLVGTKECHPLQPFALAPGFDAHGVFAKASLPTPMRLDLANLVPVLLNRYRRRYFLSADGVYRLTLDSELEFHGAGPALDRLSARARGDARRIVELKFPPGSEAGASRIASRFPFRLSRNSKYALGVETLYGH